MYAQSMYTSQQKLKRKVNISIEDCYSIFLFLGNSLYEGHPESKVTKRVALSQGNEFFTVGTIVV